MYKSLDNDLLDGAVGIEGYVVDSSAEQISNWLSKRYDGELVARLAAALRETCTTVAFVQGLWVDEDHRGQGYASSILEKTLDAAAADAVLLECDILAPQAAGFILSEFYERHGFEIVDDTGTWPIMAWPSSVADMIRSVVSTPAPEMTL